MVTAVTTAEGHHHAVGNVCVSSPHSPRRGQPARNRVRRSAGGQEGKRVRLYPTGHGAARDKVPFDFVLVPKRTTNSTVAAWAVRSQSCFCAFRYRKIGKASISLGGPGRCMLSLMTILSRTLSPLSGRSHSRLQVSRPVLTPRGVWNWGVYTPRLPELFPCE